jgi:hypothetical protein
VNTVVRQYFQQIIEGNSYLLQSQWLSVLRNIVTAMSPHLGEENQNAYDEAIENVHAKIQSQSVDVTSLIQKFAENGECLVNEGSLVCVLVKHLEQLSKVHEIGQLYETLYKVFPPLPSVLK